MSESNLRRLPDPPSSNARLGSWKEIAQYLGREVRTVQRWEKSEGLPVHRVYHARRGTVYAFPRELDQWWQSRRFTLANAPAEVPDSEELSDIEEPVAEDSAEVPEFPPAAAPPRSRWVWPSILVLIIAAGVTGWILRSSFEPHGPILSSVTNFPGDEETPALSPDGKQAAFSWNGADGSNYDIYVVRVGEGAVKRVTTAAQWDFSPAWSPAGDRIAFLRSDSATLSGNHADIVIVDPNGGPERIIGRVKSVGVALAWKKQGLTWTPDGHSLIVSGTNSEDPEGLLLVSTLDGAIRRLTLPPRGQFDLEPTLSADGRLLVFRREVSYTVHELFVVPLGGDYGPTTPERPMQAHPDVDVASPQWEAPGKLLYLSGGVLTRITTDALGSSVGQPHSVASNLGNCSLIAFSHQPTIAGTSLCTCQRDDPSIWRLDLPASPDHIRLNRLSAGQAVTLSPDGKQIGLELSGDHSTNVWIQDIDGKRPRQLTQAQHAIADSPAWSPDGGSIAFIANLEGRPSIYVAPADGGAPRRLANTITDVSLPSWSRDGKSIYVGARIAGKFEVARTPAEGGEFTQITHGGGTASSESTDGSYLFYNHRNQEAWSLRRVRMDGTEDEEIIPDIQDRAFAVAGNGIYFIPSPGADGRSSIRLLDLATRAVTVITPIQKPQRRPIVVAPDGSFLLFSQFDRWGKDLALLEGLK